jgi:hypothetical protein
MMKSRKQDVTMSPLTNRLALMGGDSNVNRRRRALERLAGKRLLAVA